MSFIRRIAEMFWIPGGIGIMGLMIALDDLESPSWRATGFIIAILASPFAVITALSILALYCLEKLSLLKSKGFSKGES